MRRFGERMLQLMWIQRLMVPQFLVGVVGIVENEGGEILLLRHTYRFQYPWGLPTGFLEIGEQPQQALHREIREETGFDVELEQIWQVYVDPKRPLVNLVFRGKYRGGAFVASDEVSDARFFPPDRLPLLLADQTRLIAASLKKEVFHK